MDLYNRGGKGGPASVGREMSLIETLLPFTIIKASGSELIIRIDNKRLTFHYLH
jgi:hypothetical protein